MKHFPTLLQCIAIALERVVLSSDPFWMQNKMKALYAFFSQTLALWMFIPVDEEGKPMEEPESLKGYYETHPEGMKEEAILRKKYEAAKKRVMFEGFLKVNSSFYNDSICVSDGITDVDFRANGKVTILGDLDVSSIDRFIYEGDFTPTQSAREILGVE